MRRSRRRRILRTIWISRFGLLGFLLFALGMNVWETHVYRRMTAELKRSMNDLEATRKRLEAAIAELHVPTKPTGKKLNVIHAPPEGKCPDHWTLQAKAFTEKNGEPRGACVDEPSLQKDGPVFDVLDSGESFGFGFIVPSLPMNPPAQNGGVHL